MENENRTLRSKLNSFQMWMERQVEKGLIDIENTPDAFDRSRNSLRELESETRNIGQSCHWCQKKFLKGETKHTDNHVFFFHFSCKTAFDKADERNVNFEQGE